MLLRNTIAGKWNVIAPQEAVEYLQHNYLTTHFFVSHFAVCAFLFNKDTFYSDLRVSSVHIHDTTSGQMVVKEGQNGWVLQGVISRATCRRQTSLHYDVSSLEQQLCQGAAEARKMWCSQSVLLCNRNKLTRSPATSTVQRGDESAVKIIDATAQLRRRS